MSYLVCRLRLVAQEKINPIIHGGGFQFSGKLDDPVKISKNHKLLTEKCGRPFEGPPKSN